MATSRINWDISINDSKQISGGFLETRYMSKTEVKRYCINLGKEFLRNNLHIDRISYSCWETDDDMVKDVGNLENVFISVYRVGRKIKVLEY